MKTRAMVWLSLLLGAAYLAPNHYVPWLSFHQELLAAIAFIPLLMWALNSRTPFSFIAYLFGLLAIVPLFQLWIGRIEFAGDAYVAFLYILGFAVAIAAGNALTSLENSAADLKALTPLFACFVFAALISVGIALHQWLGLELSSVFLVEMRAGARPYGNLAQANQLATLLLLGLVGVIFLYETRLLGAAVSIVAGTMLVIGLAMTQSRTILLAILIIWAALIFLKKRTQLTISISSALALTFLFFLVSWAWPFINDSLLLSTSSSLGARLGQDLRITLWASMLDAIGRAPLLGYGWNQIPLAQQAVALDHPATHWFFSSAHNILLDIALWSGLPIALGISIGLVMWAWRQVRVCRDPLSWCALLAVGLVLCHAMVEHPLTYAYFLLPTGLLVGALSSRRIDLKWSSRVFPSRLFRLSVAIIGILLFTSIVTEYFPLEQDRRSIRFEQARIEIDHHGKTPETHILTQLREDSLFARAVPRRNMSMEQIDWMRRVSERFAWAASSFKYAEALALNGRPDAAAVALEKLCRIQPKSRCALAIREWKELAAKEYPEFRLVSLPVVADQ